MSSLDFWVFISSLADRNFLIFVSAILIIYFLYKKDHTKAVLLSVTYLGGIVLNKMLKEIFQVPRPANPLITIEGYGFPSGHAMSAVIFYSLLILLLYPKIKNNRIRIIFVTINVFVIILVGLSRIMLNVHSIYDVVGGYVIGLLWLFLVYKILERIKF